MIITGASFAQSRTSLMGPKAKNYKPWENKVVNPTSHLTEPSKKEFGGKAKNQRPVLYTEEVAVTQNNFKRSQLMGPKAKNYRAGLD